MSQPLLHLATQVFDCPLAILPEKLDILLQVVGPRLAVDEAAMRELRATGVLSPNGGLFGPDRLSRSSRDDEKPYQVTDAGIAIIPISGTLMKKGGWMSALSGCSSYESLANAINVAREDSLVRGILFDVNSPGGTTHGMFDLADLIYGMRGEKPMYAIANDLAASAAYCLASSADKLFVTRTAGVGSIGVYAVHVNYAEADKKAGVQYTYISYGDKKTNGNEHEPISKSARKDIQSEVDREGELFVNTVARNRGKSYQSIFDTQAGVLFAENSLPLLADAVGTFEDALAELTSKVLGRNDTIPAKSGKRADAEGIADMSKVAKAADKTDKSDKSEEDVKDKQDGKQDEKPADKPKAKSDDTADDDEDDDKNMGKSGAAADDSCDPDLDEEKEMADKNAKTETAQPAAAAPASTTPTPAAPAAATETFGLADVDMINDLCALAGQPDLAAEFIKSRTPVAEVRKALLDKRAEASAKTQVSGSFGTASTDALDTVMKQASALAANSGGKLSQSEAYAQVLRNNPQLYMQYEDERANAALTPNGIRQYVRQAQGRVAAMGLSAEIG